MASQRLALEGRWWELAGKHGQSSLRRDSLADTLCLQEAMLGRSSLKFGVENSK